MKIEILSEIKTVMSAHGEKNYFAWPTVARLRDGRIAAACSGFRLEHICPFGKAVISYSDDEGESFSAPEAVIDTSLDDRDAGLCPFGESGLIITSFNNSVEFQRANCDREFLSTCLEYLDTVSPEDEKRDLGVTFRISRDGGMTFGKVLHSPVTSPHGPTELSSGKILWVGRVFSSDDSFDKSKNMLEAWELSPEDGKMTKLGEIENVTENGVLLSSCEPYALELPDGNIICHIRMENGSPHYFSTYQSVSRDGGKTWSKPEALLPQKGGAPAHLIRTPDGLLVSVYGYREKPYGIRAMISADGGKTWEKDFVLYEQTVSSDLGYPGSVILRDGSILTVFYAHKSDTEPANIFSVKWRITK